MPNDFEAELNNIIQSAIADGLNQAAEVALSDIKTHVQVRSGRLRDSYAIIKRATPNNPTIEIDSTVDYKNRHYPIKILPNYDRATQGNPLATPDSDLSRYAEMTQTQLEEAINRELSQ